MPAKILLKTDSWVVVVDGATVELVMASVMIAWIDDDDAAVVVVSKIDDVLGRNVVVVVVVVDAAVEATVVAAASVVLEMNFLSLRIMVVVSKSFELAVGGGDAVDDVIEVSAKYEADRDTALAAVRTDVFTIFEKMFSLSPLLLFSLGLPRTFKSIGSHSGSAACVPKTVPACFNEC